MEEAEIIYNKVAQRKITDLSPQIIAKKKYTTQRVTSIKKAEKENADPNTADKLKSLRDARKKSYPTTILG